MEIHSDQTQKQNTEQKWVTKHRILNKLRAIILTRAGKSPGLVGAQEQDTEGNTEEEVGLGWRLSSKQQETHLAEKHME